MLLSLCRIINRYTCYVQSKPFKQEVSHTVIPPLTKQVSILWIRYLYLIVSTKSQISISERILGDLVALLWPNAQLAFLYVVTPILQLFSINYPTNRISWNDFSNKMTHFYFRALVDLVPLLFIINFLSLPSDPNLKTVLHQLPHQLGILQWLY